MNDAVVIVTAVDFPTGLAGTFRVKMFARAFIHSGHKVFCLFQYLPGVVDNRLNQKIQGEIEGVNFKYCIGTVKPPSSIFRMLVYKLIGPLMVVYNLFTLAKKERVRYLFSYGNTFLEDAIYLLASRVIGVKMIVEICDDATIIRRSNKEVSLIGLIIGWLKFVMMKMKEEIIVRLSDYVFVISMNLYKKYEGKVRNGHIILTPILADHEAYEIHSAKTISRDYKIIIWIGNFREWEGLEDLVEALQILRYQKGFEKFRCHIYGVTNKHKQYSKFINEKIGQSKMSKFIELREFVPHEILLRILKEADMAVISRKNGEINRAGFPTKLIDYLMSGLPVVTTPVGEIYRVFYGRNEVFMSRNDGANAIADAIHRLLLDNELAERIAAQGKLYAIKNYDFRIVGEKIKELFNTKAASVSRLV
ncbi:glycosyltransferase family 4 protein [Candidatus Poribacteria bacterium]|nr:glycosyltransferase family 4 protein [Candidatus Poribacteria bacterium]